MSSPGSSSSSDSSASSSSNPFDPSTLTQLQQQQHPRTTTTDLEQAINNLDPTTIEANSQATTTFTLSGFTNNNSNPMQSQNTDLTSIINTQTTNGPSQPISKTAHHVITAPSRGWMSQRKGRAVHIEDDPQSSLRNEIEGEFEDLDQSSEQHLYTSSHSSQRIIELGIVEEQLSQLLNLASDVLGSLGPPLDEDESTTTAIKSFSSSINEYFELLNKIQSRLRSSMSYLRVARISTRSLFEPAHVTIPNCPVGLGDLNLTATHSLSSINQTAPVGTTDPTFNFSAPNHHQSAGKGIQESSPTLSLGSLVAERNAWKDLVDSLELIKAQQRSNPV
ncbi:hypothetical protein MJO28_007684 [Puccinia striiformis f. sp. tritici]|uniref:Mediator of RNA polymerase II transcription subunit 11 n=2 Tax=Puccinia striiformis f. sp. tritici TaxID=168172 RepID=A0A0L0VAX5_9BASI|nr:hypothetical protein Pst134EA_013764 [Puccinia striiformis f. sp. tritici]KAI9627134.1 hypothetical protein H4Q26_017522 [Puccinia striiformis f. sp. tritici PST-130]KNE96423.1 hypothetical protein PSTG_10255 [Puccinia striiformis f. sp. tritici PST-78]KAH9465908.1 hypothetical protein Pst134EA_013764 [Puccinia striiformis f. sp. tritici]KAI7952000.1 hypothetical protein MJO28_007684 [Puccinia striiformis f. sp. tritici]KAI7956224.1 hypothetical protein MJO29_007623 [Puccinia striiformis f.